jgi:hypothetical protein
MDDPMFASTAGNFEVERRLDAFARARLSPAAGSKARTRARVMREARLAFEAQAQAAAVASVVGRMPAATHRSPFVRRGGGLLLAAGLALGVAGGAMAASDAGGPLYPTRIWFETFALPSNPSDRADAEIDRLSARLAEITEAANRGDEAGVEAALLAYQQIADEAFAGAGGDSALTERLAAALSNHVTVLQGVAAKVPPQAREAIERNIVRAIDHNDATIERSRTHPVTPGAGSNPNPNPGPGSNGTTPDKSPKPTKEPTVAATPHPTQPAHPADPTPAIDPPKGPPSEKPDKGQPEQNGKPTP